MQLAFVMTRSDLQKDIEHFMFDSEATDARRFEHMKHRASETEIKAKLRLQCVGLREKFVFNISCLIGWQTKACRFDDMKHRASKTKVRAGLRLQLVGPGEAVVFCLILWNCG